MLRVCGCSSLAKEKQGPVHGLDFLLYQLFIDVGCTMKASKDETKSSPSLVHANSPCEQSHSRVEGFIGKLGTSHDPLNCMEVQHAIVRDPAPSVLKLLISGLPHPSTATMEVESKS